MDSIRTSAAHPALVEIRAGIDRLLTDLADGRVAGLSHEQLTATLVETRREQARLESAVLTTVGEVDARGSHVHEGALTTPAWLRRHTRATPAEATATVRTARVLRSGELPATAAALAEGDITPRHTQVIAAGAADAPSGSAALIEPEALEAAREADVRAVSSVMTMFAHALDPEAADQAALRRYDRRGLSLAATLDGSVALSGLADETSGAVIATAVDAASPPVTDDRRTPSQRRLDGLTDICRRYLEAPDAPRRGGGHPHVLVSTDAVTLSGPPAPASDGFTPSGSGSPGGTLSWVGRIAGSTARRIACDADVTTVVLGPEGEVMSAATERRYFTPAQRRAMIARDGDRCIWPWCDRPVVWSDGHHLQWYSSGGATTVENGALPCAAHHTSLHEGGWTADRLPDGRYLVRHRDGRTLGPEPHPPGHNRPPPRPTPHRRQ